MDNTSPYSTHSNIMFEHLQLIDISRIVNECTDRWFNQSLTVVNDSVVRIGIVQGEYHWHKHNHDDEFFLVLEGKLFIDVENGTHILEPMQGMTVSKGTLHRTRAPQRTVMLMMETKNITPTGD